MTAGRSGAGWAALVVIGAALATAPGYRTAAAPDDDVVLTLVDQDFAIAADDPWTASYTIEGTGAVLDDLATTTTVAPPASTGAPTAAPGPAAGVVTVRLHGRIGARAALQDALSGDVGPPLDELELPLDEVITVDGDEVSLALAVPTTTEPSETALTLPAPGLYPVSIEVRAGSRSLAEHATFLDRLPIEPAAAPAMGVAVLATIDDPGVAAATDQLAAAHEQLEALVELGTTADAPLSVALPPAVEPVLVEDPELADALGDALATSELLPLPARQLDPSSATAVGVADAFSRELRAGEDVLARLLPESPTRRAAWLVTAPLSAAAGGQLRDPLGFRLLVIDEATYSSLDGNIGAFLDPTLSVDVALAGGASLPATVLSPLGAELA
ncbi:MAG: hypothetical protein M3487_05155, partial [Actinomycetota bacterium]|nr:hypothetical protein [Actinomycetota bacterium]